MKVVELFVLNLENILTPFYCTMSGIIDDLKNKTDCVNSKS